MRSIFRSVLVALVAVLALGAVAAVAAQAEAPRWFDNGVALEAGHSENVTVSGPTQRLSFPNDAVTITCGKGVSGSGSVTGGSPGTGKLAVTLTGCSVNISGCEVVKSKGEPNGTIATEPLKTTLETRGGVIHDKFKGESSETVINLEIAKELVEGKGKGACGVLAVHYIVAGEGGTNIEGSTLLLEGEGNLNATGLGYLDWNGRLKLALTNGHTLTAG